MRDRSELSPTNLLAQLEATALLDPEATDADREQALERAHEVQRELTRGWRARRRPSPGRSKSLRQVGLFVINFFVLCLSLQGAICDRAGCGTGQQANGVVCFTPARPVSLSGELKAVDPNPSPLRTHR
jgi:hypothetical protein